MWIVGLSWCGSGDLLEYCCSELGQYFSFRLCSTGLGRVEVLFCQLCILHRDCAGIARQAGQCSGSVAYLFPLTVAAVLEGGAVHIFQSIDTSHFWSNCTREDKIIYTGKCFHCDCAIGKGVFPQSLFICCSGIVVIRHMGSVARSPEISVYLLSFWWISRNTDKHA